MTTEDDAIFIFYLDNNLGKVVITDSGNPINKSKKNFNTDIQLRNGYCGFFEKNDIKVFFKVDNFIINTNITLHIENIRETHWILKIVWDRFYSKCKENNIELSWTEKENLSELMGLNHEIYKKLNNSKCVKCGFFCKTNQQLAGFSDSEKTCRKCRMDMTWRTKSSNNHIDKTQLSLPIINDISRIDTNSWITDDEVFLFKDAKEIIEKNNINTVLDLIDRFSLWDGISFGINKVDDSGYSLLHYAVKCNKPNVVKWLIEQRGADVDNLSEKGEHSLLLCFLFLSNPDFMLITLLSKRANPCFIPKDLVWPLKSEEYKKAILLPKDIFDKIKYYFVNDEFKSKLQNRMTLTSIYILRRAYTMLFLKPTAVKIIKDMEMEPLLEIFLTMVGQTLSIKRFIINMISSQLIIRPGNSPNVFLFAGHSGHGKTFLAKTVAEKLDCESIVISCGNIRTLEGMFGGVAPYQGYQKGSDLNNFLASNNHKRSVVVLDEFDKIGSNDIYNGFLELFETGNGFDHRIINNNKINSQKTIWILTTNIANSDIDEFVIKTKYMSQDPYFFDVDKRTSQQSSDFDKLENTIRKSCKSAFGKPITSRIKYIVPFLPFCRQEQIVLIDQQIRILEEQYAMSENAYQHDKLYIKNLHIKSLFDDDFFDYLIESYDEDAGVRSIHNGVVLKFHTYVCEQYLSEKIQQGDKIFIGVNDDIFETYRSQPIKFNRIKL